MNATPTTTMVELGKSISKSWWKLLTPKKTMKGGGRIQKHYFYITMLSTCCLRKKHEIYRNKYWNRLIAKKKNHGHTGNKPWQSTPFNVWRPLFPERKGKSGSNISEMVILLKYKGRLLTYTFYFFMWTYVSILQCILIIIIICTCISIIYIYFPLMVN